MIERMYTYILHTLYVQVVQLKYISYLSDKTE